MTTTLWDAYLADDSRLRPWFAMPWRSTAYAAAWAQRVGEHPAWQRAALAQIATAATVGTSAATQANAAALGKPGTYAIVTGQQPALGGGPLYSLLKCATAIATAQRLRAEGISAVPVFWCASEDHDLGEANHADLVCTDGRLSRVTAAYPHAGASLRFQPASAGWADLHAALECVGGTSAHAAWFAHLTPRTDETLGAWHCRLLHTVFADAGLVCIEAHALRPLMQRTLDTHLTDWPAKALAERRSEVLATGFADSFGAALDQPPLFRDAPPPAGRTAIGVGKARALLASGELSPGAALRPILQQAALPCLAYCAGPGELGYHAFLGPAYAAFAVPQPLLLPRLNATLLGIAQRRGLARWGVSVDDLRPGAALPAAASDPRLHAHLEKLGTELNALAASGDLPGDLAKRRDAGIARLRRELARMRGSIDRGLRELSERPALGHLRDWCWPRGQRQERVMSMSQALWLGGPGVAGQLIAAAASTAPGQHAQVELG